jgi:hypothetical protein
MLRTREINITPMIYLDLEKKERNLEKKEK